MKKVGVITFSGTSHNYGQILQCYAMQLVLKQLGFQPFLITFRNTRISFKVLSFSQKIIKILGAVSYFIKKHTHATLSISLSPQNEVDRGFNNFISKHITTQHYGCLDLLYTNPPQADAYICGSDQIWGTMTPLYYLDFVSKGGKKIAYAPSYGGGKLNLIDKFKLRWLIKDFSHISVREEDGVKICSECGRPDAIVVPDPTLIVDKESYRAIASNNKVPNKPYILVYMLKNTTDFDMEELKKETKKKNLEIVYITANGLEDEYEKIYPNIDEWLGLMNNATYVVTNSFHCTVFSIIFNKPFRVFYLIGEFAKMNLRISQLLLHYHLKHTETYNFDSQINYEQTNRILAEDRKKIQSMIKDWIIN